MKKITLRQFIHSFFITFFCLVITSSLYSHEELFYELLHLNDWTNITIDIRQIEIAQKGNNTPVADINRQLSEIDYHVILLRFRVK